MIAITTLAFVWTLAIAVIVHELARRQAAGASEVGADAPRWWPDVTCLCPMADGDAVTHFSADEVAAARYPGRMRWVFLASETEPAAMARATARAQAARAGGAQASVLQTHAFGSNRKAAQLAALPALDADEVAICVDSDVELASVRWAALVQRLIADDTTALVWQAPTPGAPCVSAGDAVARAVLAGGAHAFPLLGALDPHSPVGKVVAYRPDALAAAGGWRSVAYAMGEDVAIGVRLRRQGYRVAALHGAPARTLRQGESVRAVWQRLGRWLQVVRRQRPWLTLSYPGYVCCLPCLLATWAFAGAWGAPTAWVAGGVVLTLCTRLRLGALAQRSRGDAFAPWSAVRDAIVGDCVLLAAVVACLSTRRVWWNGRRWEDVGASVTGERAGCRRLKPRTPAALL